MNWINDYMLSVKYVDGGRGPTEFDCWGLAREVRHKHCGKRLLPSWGHLRNNNPKEFTRAYRAESAAMEACQPEHGAIAAVFINSLCVHVGVVIEVPGIGLWALEINPGKGASFKRVLEFQAQYLKVIYYRDN
jgi:hypothetical protein